MNKPAARFGALEPSRKKSQTESEINEIQNQNYQQIGDLRQNSSHDNGSQALKNMADWQNLRQLGQRPWENGERIKNAAQGIDDEDQRPGQ